MMPVSTGRHHTTGRGPVRLALAAGAVLLALGACTTTGVGPSAQSESTGRSTSSAVTTTPVAGPASIQVNPPLGTADYPPGDPLTVQAAGGTLTVVTVRTANGVPVPGTLSADRTTWTAGELLGYDRSYSVAARAQNADGQPAEVSGSIGTATP